MKVLVIGAGGKTGSLVVERAVAAGHTVSVLMRDPAKAKFAAGVNVIGGDALRSMDVRGAVAGQDAVIDCIGGTTPWKTMTLEGESMRQIVDAMEADAMQAEGGATRLIVTSALGVGESRLQSPWWYRFLVLPTFLRGSTKDKAAMEARVTASALEYVIARPPMLSDAPATGRTTIVADGGTAHKITRADLAQWMVEQLTSDEFLGRAVVVANG